MQNTTQTMIIFSSDYVVIVFGTPCVRSHKKQRPLSSPSIKHHIVIMPFGTLALVSNLSFQRSAIRVTLITSVRILRHNPSQPQPLWTSTRHPICYQLEN